MKPNTLYLGAHVSFKKPSYLVGSVEEALSYQANTLMIYLGAPQNTARVDVSAYQIAAYAQKYQSQIRPEHIVVHAPYIVNPASSDKAAFACEFLTAEIKRMHQFNARYLVLHPGAHTTSSREAALATLVTSLQTILKATSEVEILLETMAGKGSELGNSLEELADILARVNDARLGICLDTCHVWDAGYDIRNDWAGFVKQLEELNLLARIKVVHINDSKNPLGARKDRHANLGAGLIGEVALARIVYAPELQDALKILETPYIDDEPPYAEEISRLKAHAKLV